MWRQIAGQPSDALTRPEDEEEEEPLPSHFNTNNFGNFLDVEKDKLTVRYTGQGNHNNDVGAIQGNRPVPRKRRVYYYEVTVLDAGSKGLIGVGFADKNFKMGKQPGWEQHSYGYHGDDGKKFHASGQGEDYGPHFSAGDVIGAGIHIQRQEIFFTKNGKNLGTAFRGLTQLPLYPTIGLHSPGECIVVNFGASPFAFKLDAMLEEEREQQEAAVQSIPIPAGVTHRLVREYLLHYGYADTLRAFDAAAGTTEDAPQLGSSSWSERDAAAMETLWQRQAIRQHMMAGDVESANTLLMQHFPELVVSKGGARPDLDVYFYVNCMQFIELIREDRIEEAVIFAQASLSPMRGLLTHRNRAYDAMLHDVVALLAYENPMDSPLAGLMHLAQREAAADVVNSAILAATAAKLADANRPTEGPSKAPAQLPTEPKPQVFSALTASLQRTGPDCTAAVERLLQQLVVVQNELLVANNGLGEPFRLSQHLGAAPGHKPQQPHSNGVTPMDRD
ncbi:Ran-binding protein 10 [Coccomyxa sp. Obi]|nr:Ran-binding protein 10 [Coccomyxa sp. Obi]